MSRILITLTFVLFTQICFSNEIDITKELISKWVETKKLISLESEEWKIEQEVLTDRIDLISSERNSLKEKINETENLINQSDTKRTDLGKDNESLKKASTLLSEKINILENKLLILLPTLPQHIQEKIKPLSQRIPLNKKNELTLSERYQNVVGIVNELNKGASEISVISEVRSLLDGGSAEVQTLYLGYAHAFYCTTKGDIAGIGYPSRDGWVWKPKNEIAQEIADSIAIFKNEMVAEYITLPINMDEE
tara:strand:+ start:2050 stop:2802 length:753 start_codon:yes stop_codon:yes gene_type:complete